MSAETKAECWNARMKCRRCGVIATALSGGEEIMGIALTKTLVHGSCGDYGIPMTLLGIHSCADGAQGVTDLIGCEPSPDVRT